jgi:hypothetical protein
VHVWLRAIHPVTLPVPITGIVDESSKPEAPN